MLRAIVTLSRKLSRDYQSTGYSVTLDGEVGTNQDDPKAILDAIDRLYRLAEDALAREIDRDQGEGAISRRDGPKHKREYPILRHAQRRSRPGPRLRLGTGRRKGRLLSSPEAPMGVMLPDPSGSGAMWSKNDIIRETRW